MNGSPELDRQRILELFDELSAELKVSRTRAQIYIVGGAAMSLAFSRERTTLDVDARIDTGHSGLWKAVQTIGRRHGLSDTWLNEQAIHFMPGKPDARARTVYQSPWLTVTGASTKHLLAMKLMARRPGDRNDIATLTEHLKLREPREAIRIYEELFPGVPLKLRARRLVEEAFRERSAEHER